MELGLFGSVLPYLYNLALHLGQILILILSDSARIQIITLFGTMIIIMETQTLKLMRHLGRELDWKYSEEGISDSVPIFYYDGIKLQQILILSQPLTSVGSLNFP